MMLATAAAGTAAAAPVSARLTRTQPPITRERESDRGCPKDDHRRERPEKDRCEHRRQERDGDGEVAAPQRNVARVLAIRGDGGQADHCNWVPEIESAEDERGEDAAAVARYDRDVGG